MLESDAKGAGNFLGFRNDSVMLSLNMRHKMNFVEPFVALITYNIAIFTFFSPGHLGGDGFGWALSAEPLGESRVSRHGKSTKHANFKAAPGRESIQPIEGSKLHKLSTALEQQGRHTSRIP